MRPVIVTDVRYRTALAVIRPLGRAGYPVYAVQTAAESPRRPAAFSSRYVYKAVMLEGSVKDKDYAERLLALCTRVAKNGEKPVLFPIGADTLAMLSHDRARFRAVCDFLAAPPEVLDRANDKRAVAQAAAACGVPVPREYADPDTLPPLPSTSSPANTRSCSTSILLPSARRNRWPMSLTAFSCCLLSLALCSSGARTKRRNKIIYHLIIL